MRMEYCIRPILINRSDNDFSELFWVETAVIRGGKTLDMELDIPIYICSRVMATLNTATEAVPMVVPKMNCPDDQYTRSMIIKKNTQNEKEMILFNFSQSI